jgi:hypothetical protein
MSLIERLFLRHRVELSRRSLLIRLLLFDLLPAFRGIAFILSGDFASWTRHDKGPPSLYCTFFIEIQATGGKHFINSTLIRANSKSNVYGIIGI